jgi:hypothetical protein
MGWGGFDGAVGEPLAGFFEVFVEEVHNEVDGAAVGVADEAAVGVAAGVEGEGGVMVGVEGAEGFVESDFEAEAGGDFLDGDFP